MFNNILERHTTKTQYTIKRTPYNIEHYLVVDIYSE